MPRSKSVLPALTLALALAASLGAGSPPKPAPPFPEGADRWIGEPVTWGALKGRVVLLDVWTFGWINCERTLPWVRGVLDRYGSRGFEVVGIHSPEFAYERDRKAVERAVKREALRYPQYLDNDLAYWKALQNEAWPTLYLVDRCGLIRGGGVGEVHEGEASGKAFDKAIEALLAEEAGRCGP